MKKLLATLAIIASAALPAGAIPQNPDYVNGGQCAGPVGSLCRYSLDIVNPEEEMVVVPGLEDLGPSRISTVEFCSEINEIGDWKNLITDSDFLSMEGCIIDQT